MVKYEIQYRCFLSTVFHDWVTGTPIIHYRYRKWDKLFWEDEAKVRIDDFAFRVWKEYYDGINIDTLHLVDLGERMRIMKTILRERYNNSLGDYVRRMIETEIRENLAEKDDAAETHELCLSFVTDGWRFTPLDIETKKAGA